MFTHATFYYLYAYCKRVITQRFLVFIHTVKELSHGVFLSLRALRKPFRAAFVNHPLRFNLRFTQNFLDIIQLIQCFERRQAVHIEA